MTIRSVGQLGSILILLALACTRPGSDPASLARTGIISAGGIDFEYFVEGDGRTCLVVGDALTVSRAVSARLKEDIRFVFLSSRMTTPEAQVGEVSSIGIGAVLEDIEQARRTLGLDRVCIMGHSISGFLALEYARKYPGHVSHVIMHGTPPFADERLAAAVRAYWEAEASPERKQALEHRWSEMPKEELDRLSPSEAAIQTYLNNAPYYFHDPWYDPAWLLEGAHWNMAVASHLSSELSAGYDLGGEPAVQVPVFVAVGRSDFAAPYHLWEYEISKIAKGSLQVFDESGHFPMLEEQERFDELLLAWLGETAH